MLGPIDGLKVIEDPHHVAGEHYFLFYPDDDTVGSFLFGGDVAITSTEDLDRTFFPYAQDSVEHIEVRAGDPHAYAAARVVASVSPF